MIRIANGQGFWGDSIEAPIEQVRRGPIDYLTLDYLAEITMSIVQKQKARDPRQGYARDFVEMIARVLPDLIERRVKVIANAGGVNPEGCRDAIVEVVKRLGLQGKVKIGIVAGDDLMPQLDALLARGIELKNMETGEPLSSIRPLVQSANVYLGAWPVVEALRQGADIVVCGRVTDTGLALAPMIHEFGWGPEDWHRLAAGTIAGHTVECGAQCTGGNCQVGWQTTPHFADIGYPIIEAEPDGTFVITKHAGTGGRVSIPSVKEQLLYELGDPKEYITPDCIADFTSIQLSDAGPDRVRFSGIQGRPYTPFYKVSVSYTNGFKAAGTLVYSWPDAFAKARLADQILRERLDRLGLKYDAVVSEYVGAGACHGLKLAGPPEPDTPEVLLRIGVRSQNKAAVDRFTKELAPLALNGPPVVTGFGSGRPAVQEIVAYWPALMPKIEVTPAVTVTEA